MGRENAGQSLTANGQEEKSARVLGAGQGREGLQRATTAVSLGPTRPDEHRQVHGERPCSDIQTNTVPA